MSVEIRTFPVPIGGYEMQLRAAEVDAVAAGVREVAGSQNVTPAGVAGAVAALPVSDRAPAWELAIRHFGRRKPVEQAAGEIGMDVTRGRALAEAFTVATR